MTASAPAPNPAAQLLQYRSQLVLHQAIAAVAKFGVADLLERGVHSTSALAQEVALNEDALYRTLRALAAQGIFEETSPCSFRNTPLSNPLRSDIPQSVRVRPDNSLITRTATKTKKPSLPVDYSKLLS